VKRCPTCNKTFADHNLSFCLDDGTPLVITDAADETTLIMSSPEAKDSSTPPSNPSGAGERASAYQPPSPYVPPGAYNQPKRKTWPWFLGIVVIVFIIFAGLGIAAALLIPRILSASSNSNTTNLNANIDRRSSSSPNPNNQNFNSTYGNENGNANSVGEDTTVPPTDREAVLADLKNLEDEWQAANINADTKKLNRILADDYVGITDGRPQGKSEYLKTIKRDTSIQHWEYEDLKVSLNGDRASLAGIIRLDVKDENGEDRQLAFRFTDKFVWRDGRWQATSSEVDPVKEPPGVVSWLDSKQQTVNSKQQELALAQAPTIVL
jgi:ketosteroid isomerase-like protein